MSSAARFLALQVSAARWVESDLDWLRILSGLVTKALQFEAAKVPQPGVDLVIMTAPAGSLDSLP